MNNLEDIAGAVLPSLGYELLELQIQNSQGRAVIVFRIERLDEQPITVEDLEKVSSVLSLEMDRHDPIRGEYRLEVESPGPKRPLKSARHFERMLGLKAKVRSDDRNFTAVIEKVEGEQVTFDLEGEKIMLEIGRFQANLAEFPPTYR